VKTVHKYEINLHDLDRESMAMVKIRKGATLLSVGTQRFGYVAIWAQVDTETPMMDWQIWIYGTGHTIAAPDTAKFLGTVFMDGLVFHVFYEATDGVFYKPGDFRIDG